MKAAIFEQCQKLFPEWADSSMTVMRHQQPDYPYFRIAEPAFGDLELGMLIDFYLDNADFTDQETREIEFKKLLNDTKDMLLMSDYKYAMAALPLAVEPIQKIRFIPYAHQRFSKFLRTYAQRFEDQKMPRPRVVR